MPYPLDPLSKNHYHYLNELLNIEEEKKLKTGDKINEDFLKKAKETLENLNKEHKNNEEIALHNQKMQRILDTLSDPEKKKQYDAGLQSIPNVHMSGSGKSITLVPLVPIEDIIKEFESFRTMKLNEKDREGNPLFKEGDFRYRKEPGPPEMHIFTFPDEACLNQFLQTLFDKNRAMLPKGSQDINDVKRALKKQNPTRLAPPMSTATPKVEPVAKTETRADSGNPKKEKSVEVMDDSQKPTY